MRGRRVFGDVVFYFYVKREDGEGGAGRSSVQKVWRYEIVILLCSESAEI